MKIEEKFKFKDLFILSLNRTIDWKKSAFFLEKYLGYKVSLALFSCPYAGDFFEYAKKLSNLYCWKVTVSNKALDIQNNCDSTDNFNQTDNIGIRPEFGALWTSKMLQQAEDSNTKWVCAQTAIASFFSGQIKNIELTLRSNLPLTIYGRSYKASKIDITADINRFVIVLDDHKTISLSAKSLKNGSTIWLNDSFKNCFINLGSMRTIPMVHADWVSEWGIGESPKFKLDGREKIFIRRVERAYDILETHCKEYYLWSISLLHEIVGLDSAEDSTISSQSFSCWPNQIHFQARDSLLTVLELIVHENSHMYFSLIEAYDPIAKPNAPQVFSILKKKKRPLKTVLFTFHAVANILLMFYALSNVASFYKQIEIHKKISEFREMAQNLIDVLKKHKKIYMTDIAEKVFQILVDEVETKSADYDYKYLRRFEL